MRFIHPPACLMMENEDIADAELREIETIIII